MQFGQSALAVFILGVIATNSGQQIVHSICDLHVVVELLLQLEDLLAAERCPRPLQYVIGRVAWHDGGQHSGGARVRGGRRVGLAVPTPADVVVAAAGGGGRRRRLVCFRGPREPLDPHPGIEDCCAWVCCCSGPLVSTQVGRGVVITLGASMLLVTRRNILEVITTIAFVGFAAFRGRNRSRLITPDVAIVIMSEISWVIA